MKSSLVTYLGDLDYIGSNDPDRFDEVCIDAQLPKEMEKKHKLRNYDISVRFHNEEEIDVFVYDNKANETANIEFAPEVRKRLIEFARKHISQTSAANTN